MLVCQVSHHTFPEPKGANYFIPSPPDRCTIGSSFTCYYSSLELACLIYVLLIIYGTSAINHLIAYHPIRLQISKLPKGRGLRTYTTFPNTKHLARPVLKTLNDTNCSRD